MHRCKERNEVEAATALQRLHRVNGEEMRLKPVERVIGLRPTEGGGAACDVQRKAVLSLPQAPEEPASRMQGPRECKPPGGIAGAGRRHRRLSWLLSD